jgi:hypothetical protein
MLWEFWWVPSLAPWFWPPPAHPACRLTGPHLFRSSLVFCAPHLRPSRGLGSNRSTNGNSLALWIPSYTAIARYFSPSQRPYQTPHLRKQHIKLLIAAMFQDFLAEIISVLIGQQLDKNRLGFLIDEGCDVVVVFHQGTLKGT